MTIRPTTTLNIFYLHCDGRELTWVLVLLINSFSFRLLKVHLAVVVVICSTANLDFNIDNVPLTSDLMPLPPTPVFLQIAMLPPVRNHFPWS